MNKDFYIHESADVQTTAIGKGSKIWQFVVILPGAKIGEDANICSHCFIENEVVIGNRVTLKSGVQLWDGISIEDDVFIGPNVSFTNDKFPRSKKRPETFLKTQIKRGASIGASAVILPGITIGAFAMVAAGAIVSQSVPPYGLVKNEPARLAGFVHEPLLENGAKTFSNKSNTGVRGVTLHHFKAIEDARGILSFGEFLREIPFSPKRYFLVYDVPDNKVRGQHAHYNCEQFLICLKGSCFVLVDDGKNRREIALNSPTQGIYLPPLTWALQYKYSKDAILLVFTSDYYDKDDYIYDYEAFSKLGQKQDETV